MNDGRQTATGQRLAPEYWGASSWHARNSRPRSGDNPIFVPEMQDIGVTKVGLVSPSILVVERYLYSRLALDAAFQPRVPSLLTRLKRRAEKYLTEFDTSTLRPDKATEIILKAVAAAYVPSTYEEEVRCWVASNKNRALIQVHNAFLQETKSGLLDSLRARFTQALSLPS